MEKLLSKVWLGHWGYGIILVRWDFIGGLRQSKPSKKPEFTKGNRSGNGFINLARESRGMLNQK